MTEGLTGANPPGDPGAAPNWGSWYRHIDPANVQGEALMDAPDGDPLLLLNRVGKGRVALLLSDQIWLWSRGHQGGGPQAELLRRVAHWLMQEPELEENALTARVAAGRLTIERRSTDPAPPGQVTVTDPDGKTQTLNLTPTTPGRATASLPAVTPGVWQASDGLAPRMPRRARPIRWSSPTCVRPGRCCGNWCAPRAEVCISSAPASPVRHRTSQSCSERSQIGPRPAVPGLAYSGVTIMW